MINEYNGTQTSFVESMKEYAEYIREKTIDECIACVPEEQHLFYDCGYSNERGHNTCREQTITNLTKLKSNEKTN